ncbi:MAG: phosphodiester glycosidase family protein [Pyrinomonadaceae bacterium]
MKKIFIGAHLCLILLSVSIFAQEFRTVQDGIEHANFTKQIKSQDGKTEPSVVNLLRLDLTKVRLDVVHAMDAAIGLETTSSIAARHGAIAAINAGFFRLDKSIFAGDAAGILQIDGKLLSESYAERIALIISNERNKTEIHFSKQNRVQALRVGNYDWDASGINRERKTDELILYTPEFHRTTLTDKNGLEVIVENKKIVWIADGKGSHLIPGNGFVLSASGKAREKLLGQIKIGETVSVGTRLYPVKSGSKDEKKLPAQCVECDIVGGVPQLVRDGKIEITWEQEKAGKSFVEMRHPRTAVAKLKDGKFLMVTVDGRQPGTSVGMNLHELAEMLLEFGAVDAMNLDGGGSTTMLVGGKVINQPSDKEGERKVSDVILVFPRLLKSPAATVKK